MIAILGIDLPLVQKSLFVNLEINPIIDKGFIPNKQNEIILPRRKFINNQKKTKLYFFFLFPYVYFLFLAGHQKSILPACSCIVFFLNYHSHSQKVSLYLYVYIFFLSAVHGLPDAVSLDVWEV